MRIVKFGLLVGSIYLLTGCSSKYPITYNSNPTGAAVVCQGINKGYTPTTLYYEPSSEQKEYGTMRTVPCTAQWISGVSKDYSSEWDLKQFPNGVMQTLQRPSGDGYEKDAQFSLQVQQMQLQQRQAAAAESAANTAAINSFNQSMQNISNQLNQNAYQTQQATYNLQQMNNQMYQQKQNKQMNYQLQQINNNLNGIRYGY